MSSLINSLHERREALKGSGSNDSDKDASDEDWD